MKLLKSKDLGWPENAIELISSKLELSQAQIIKFEICVAEEWGSQFSSHREDIHHSIEKLLTQNNHLISSISHSASMGGYVYLISKNAPTVQLGFDIERKDRLENTAIVQRISYDTEEFEMAPNSFSLWCAKEAAFKALKGKHQPNVISKIKIGGWNSYDFTPDLKNIFQYQTYHIENSQDLNITSSFGISWADVNNCYSVCFLAP